LCREITVLIPYGERRAVMPPQIQRAAERSGIDCGDSNAHVRIDERATDETGTVDSASILSTPHVSRTAVPLELPDVLGTQVSGGNCSPGQGTEHDDKDTKQSNGGDKRTLAADEEDSEEPQERNRRGDEQAQNTDADRMSKRNEDNREVDRPDRNEKALGRPLVVTACRLFHHLSANVENQRRL